MKIFHLSDLHIGARLYNRDLSEDHEYIFDEIIEKARKEKPDVMVIAGDIYDKAIPGAEAVGVFNRFISKMKKELPDMNVMMLSGNHDSAERINLFRDVLSSENIHMIGKAPSSPEERIEKVTVEDEFGPVNFYLLPFVKPSMVRPLAQKEFELKKKAGLAGEDEKAPAISSYQEAVEYLLSRETVNPEERNILVSHQFFLPSSTDPDKIGRTDSEYRTIGNIDRIDTSLIENFDYSALGHIHRPMKCGSEKIRYCGSPIPLSLSESGQKKNILMLDLNEKGNQSVSEIELTPKRQVLKLEDLAENLIHNYPEHRDDYVSLVITDPEELDMSDAVERLRAIYPNILDIARKPTGQKHEFTEGIRSDQKLSPMELCLEFAGVRDVHFDEADLDLLQDVINEAWEDGE